LNAAWLRCSFVSMSILKRLGGRGSSSGGGGGGDGSRRGGGGGGGGGSPITSERFRRLSESFVPGSDCDGGPTPDFPEGESRSTENRTFGDFRMPRSGWQGCSTSSSSLVVMPLGPSSSTRTTSMNLDDEDVGSALFWLSWAFSFCFRARLYIRPSIIIWTHGGQPGHANVCCCANLPVPWAFLERL